MIYLVHIAPTRFFRRARACGWHHATVNKAGRQYLSDQVKQLQGRNIQRIYSDDLHKSDALLVANTLGLPPDTVFAHFECRVFNVGRNHAKPEAAIEIILSDLIPQWQKNPDIPIREGDSWSSYRKRFIAFTQRLLEMEGDVILLTDNRGIRTIRDPRPESLLATSASVRSDRIYTVKRRLNAQAA